MAKYIKPERLTGAILGLANWRGAVQSQGTAHLFPFLSLLRSGVGTTGFVHYEEANDFRFFDDYFRVGSDSKLPYFDPLIRKFRIDSHPHSNIATARKGTFERSWSAAVSKQEDGKTFWKLSENAFSEIEKRVLTRATKITRVNLVDLACWLFRKTEFPDGATTDTLKDEFRRVFPMRDDDFDRLFQYVPEPTDVVFGELPLTADSELSLINHVRLEDAALAATHVAIPEGDNSIVHELSDDDPVLAEINAILSLGSSGIILRGAPGTSKSWYAQKIANRLTSGKSENIFRVQFHPSYSYEDFVEGYKPNNSAVSGFEVVPRIFLEAVKRAAGQTDPVVFIIDEINRGDPAQIFGEMLTYVEHGWRDIPFFTRLRGEQISIPRNIIIIATMNPHDRSITQLDMALLRRFDHVEISPSREVACNFVTDAGMTVQQANLVGDWFESLQKLLPSGVGHTFFLGVGDLARLNLVWRYRIEPYCATLLEFEPERLESIKASFNAIEQRFRGVPSE
jgi:hypothetical protein